MKAAALAGVLVTTGAQAADLSAPSLGGFKDEPVVVGTWWQPGDIFVRVRGLAVLPQTSTSDWRGIAGADLSATNSGVPEVDFTYFFTKNIAAELIAAVTPHTVNGEGTLHGAKIGDTWLLPPTLLLQYHLDTGTAWKPYVGAGVNYTIFFDTNAKDVASLKLGNNWGVALQAGFDYKLAGNWFLNVDFKKLWLETDANVDHGLVTSHVNLDPIIVGAGIGYRFGGYAPLK